MGAWGTAIFSDDFASDIRTRYKDLLGDGCSSEEATKQLIEETGRLDEEEAPVFWLSLAASQWKLGRLQEDVKQKALDIIESGADLVRWEEDPKLKKKREVVLQKLADQLNSPQPEAKKVPKRYIYQTDLKRGDAVSYRLLSGKYIILKVVGVAEAPSGSSPVFELCDWIGNEIPSKEQINQLPVRYTTWINGNIFVTHLSIFPTGKRDDLMKQKRIEVVAEDVSLQNESNSMRAVLAWKWLDEKLKVLYDFE